MIVTIHKGPTPELVVVRTPPDLATEMGRFGPARYDRDARVYLVQAHQLEAFSRFLTRSGHQLVDQREAAAAPSPGPGLPLPECSACGTPYKRRDAEGLRVCIACGVPGDQVVAWGPNALRPGMHPPGGPAEPTVDPTNRRAQVRELVEAAAAERPARAVRSVACPWCGVAPGQGCVSLGIGAPLRITDHHPARYAAAGSGQHQVDAEQLGRRRTPPGLPPLLPSPAEDEDGVA